MASDFCAFSSSCASSQSHPRQNHPGPAPAEVVVERAMAPQSWNAHVMIRNLSENASCACDSSLTSSSVNDDGCKLSRSR